MRGEAFCGAAAPGWLRWCTLFGSPRGRGRACPARGFPISARLPYTAGPHICGPYTAAIFYHATTANVPGTVKTVPQRIETEGENLAIAQNISGNRTVLSPTACGRSPLTEGAKG